MRDVVCLHACVSAWLKYMQRAWVNFERGRKGCGFNRDGETKWGSDSKTHARTHTPMCYWRCKNQCSAGKASPLLVPGVRLLSVAFNYSLRPGPEESHWFSFSVPPQRSRQIERLDLSIQNNTGWAHRHNSKSYFNGLLQEQGPKLHCSEFHGERA